MSPFSVTTMRTLSREDNNHLHRLSKLMERWSRRLRKYWTRGFIGESWNIMGIGLDVRCRNVHGNRPKISTMPGNCGHVPCQLSKSSFSPRHPSSVSSTSSPELGPKEGTSCHELVRTLESR